MTVGRSGCTVPCRQHAVDSTLHSQCCVDSHPVQEAASAWLSPFVCPAGAPLSPCAHTHQRVQRPLVHCMCLRMRCWPPPAAPTTRCWAKPPVPRHAGTTTRAADVVPVVSLAQGTHTPSGRHRRAACKAPAAPTQAPAARQGRGKQAPRACRFKGCECTPAPPPYPATPPFSAQQCSNSPPPNLLAYRPIVDPWPASRACPPVPPPSRLTRPPPPPPHIHAHPSR